MADSVVESLGTTGRTLRFLLMVSNILFLFLGIVLVVSGVMAKLNTRELKELILADFGQIQMLSTILLVVGTTSLLVSLFGLIGAKYLNKLFLAIYLMIVIVMFLTHSVLLVALAANTPFAEKLYQQQLNITVERLNQNSINNTVDCKLMKTISAFGNCCGVNGPQDFHDIKIVADCCASMNQTDGCYSKPIDMLKRNSRNFITIPSSVILVIEFLSILMVPFLIGRKRGDYESI